MSEYDFHKLKIDDEFKGLIPPLMPDERKQLEDNLVSDGCREPLCPYNPIMGKSAQQNARHGKLFCKFEQRQVQA